MGVLAAYRDAPEREGSRKAPGGRQRYGVDGRYVTLDRSVLLALHLPGYSDSASKQPAPSRLCRAGRQVQSSRRPRSPRSLRRPTRHLGRATALSRNSAPHSRWHRPQVTEGATPPAAWLHAAPGGASATEVPPRHLRGNPGAGSMRGRRAIVALPVRCRGASIRPRGTADLRERPICGKTLDHFRPTRASLIR